MKYYVSMFIDNELGLDEKIEFLKDVHENDEIYEESIELLEQEKLIGSAILTDVPLVDFKEKKRWFAVFNSKPFISLASAGAMAALIFMLFIPVNKNSISYLSHRFVIYKPEVSKVEISGSFTDWKAVPLTKIGSSGYWQVELDIPEGEHRYTYIIGEGERVADPTILTREQDDFGGENSILFVGA